MTIETHTLANGMRVIHRSFPSEISYCGVAVNAGSRDEYAEEHGMAHFVEHMLFKGTKRRRAHHIANRMESVGGELNAYTTKEETFIYTAFLKEHFLRAVELLSDLVLNSEFALRQIEREREVVLDEISSYQDFPSEQIYDDFENLVYEGHDIGHYILGEPESLARFNTESLLQFVRRVPTIEHDFLLVWQNTVHESGEAAGKALCVPGCREHPGEATKGTAGLRPVDVKTLKNTNQAHMMLGWSVRDVSPR